MMRRASTTRFFLSSSYYHHHVSSRRSTITTSTTTRVNNKKSKPYLLLRLKKRSASSSSSSSSPPQPAQPPPTVTTKECTRSAPPRSSSSSSTDATKFINAPRYRGRDDDALARYPTLTSAGGILRGMDYAGTITFAVTGSVTAAQSGLDMFGCSMVGMITAVGGGTIRDAIFLSKRPFWTNETEYIWMTILTGCITFFAWPHVLQWREQKQQKQQRLQSSSESTTTSSTTPSYYDGIDAALDTLDAIGLSAFAIVGAQNGIRAGMPMVVSAICGMATSTFGGLTRDVVCGRPVRIMTANAEVYAQPALAGAITYLVAKQYAPLSLQSPAIRIGSAFAMTLGSRYVAIKHDVRMHTWDTKNDGLGVAVRRNS